VQFCVPTPEGGPFKGKMCKKKSNPEKGLKKIAELGQKIGPRWA